jgi:hypothetical protein
MKKHFTIALLFCMSACAGKKEPYKNLQHYNLDKPEKFVLPDVLYEISGIAFSGANGDTVYAEQDEEGRLFHFKPGDKNIISSKFGKKGDFEDVAIYKGTVIMLRSDGVLFTFPLAEANNKNAANAKEWDNLLPGGEYEGMYADENGRLYVLCKHCYSDKTSRTGGGYIFTVGSNDSIMPAGNFELDIKEIEQLAGEKKINFHPSALAKNKNTNEWYILSSVNSMLVIADSNWKVKEIYPLSTTVFNQPEGIAFDKNNNLYISNEGGATGGGNILKFAYQP